MMGWKRVGATLYDGRYVGRIVGTVPVLVAVLVEDGGGAGGGSKALAFVAFAIVVAELVK